MQSCLWWLNPVRICSHRLLFLNRKPEQVCLRKTVSSWTCPLLKTVLQPSFKMKHQARKNQTHLRRLFQILKKQDRVKTAKKSNRHNWTNLSRFWLSLNQSKINSCHRSTMQLFKSVTMWKSRMRSWCRIWTCWSDRMLTWKAWFHPCRTKSPTSSSERRKSCT